MVLLPGWWLTFPSLFIEWSLEPLRVRIADCEWGITPLRAHMTDLERRLAMVETRGDSEVVDFFEGRS